MNRNILLVLLFTGLAASPVWAQTNSVQQVCKNVSLMAKATMKARQVGAPMSELMELTTPGNPLDGIAKVLVQRAYAIPHYSTAQSREHAVREFENDAYRECYEIRSRGTNG